MKYVCSICGTGITYVEKGLGATKEVIKTFKIKLILVFCMVFILLKCFYPSKEQIAYIIGGSIAINISQSNEAKKLPDNLLKAANSFLEQSIKLEQESKDEK